MLFLLWRITTSKWRKGNRIALLETRESIFCAEQEDVTFSQAFCKVAPGRGCCWPGARRGRCSGWSCTGLPVTSCAAHTKSKLVSLSSQKCSTTGRNGLVLTRIALPIMRILGRAVKIMRKHRNVLSKQNSWIF